jgi:hypothetical protein
MSRSENGWEPLHAGPDILNWVRIPGAEHVSLQFMKGWPTAVLRAYAADYHAYIEPLRDADSASFTPTNSVATSNHLNGTAMDLNWNSHPFRVNYAGFDAAKIDRMRELLAFYNYKGVQIVFWAQDWNSPKDAMHHQMGYNTWNNPVVGEFIRERIRPDGFSTYKRGDATAPPVLSKQDRYALEVMAEGRRRGITPRGIQIAFSVVFVESNWKMYANAKVPESLKLPHDAVGSDHDSVGLFQQRCPMWGPADVLMNPAKSAGLFYDRLAKMDYNDPSRLPGDFAADVQRPAAQYRGRYQERMGDAVDFYNRLSTNTASPGGDDMANVPQEQWDWVYNELHKQFGDRSMYPDPENPDATDTLAGRVLDARTFAWETRVEDSALRGEQWAIARVVRAAAKPGNEFLSNHAKSVLAEIEAKNPAALQEFVNGE